MLDLLSASEAEPGTNLRTDLSTSSWLYLLPRLDLARAVMLGGVPADVTEILTSIGVRVERDVAPDNPDLVVVGPDWAGSVPAAPAVYHVGRRLPASATLAPDGEPADGASSLAFPAGARRGRGQALVARGQRVSGRLAARAGLTRAGGDSAERVASRRVVRDAVPLGRSAGTLSVDGDMSALPAYVTDVARDSGIELAGRPWRVLLDGTYRSQKVVFFVGRPDGAPDLVVKVARHPSSTARLDNEHAALETLAGTSSAALAPAARFRGRHAGLSIVGESLVDGAAFSSVATWRHDDQLAARVISGLVDLGGPPLCGSAPPDEVGAGMGGLVSRHTQVYGPGQAVRSFLEARVADVARSALPTVLQHGDPGTWNVVVGPDGEARLLDWENAERRGAPTWDVAFFAQAYAMRALGRRGVRPTPRAVARWLLGDTDWGRWYVDGVRKAGASAGIDAPTTAALFVLGWVYQAVKEIPRLDPRNPGAGRAHRILVECISRWDTPMLHDLRGA